MANLDSLLEFVAVVESGTFTAASLQLGVSVSYVSRRISDLEERLSTQLFARTTRQMALTEAGRRLFDASQPLVEELLKAQESVLAAQGSLGGEIRISLAGKFAEEHLVPILTRFADLHPQVTLQVDISTRNVDLASEGFHLSVRMGPLASSASIIAKPLVYVPMVVLASKKLLSRLPLMRGPADLPAELCMRLVGRSWEFVKNKKHVRIEPSGRISSNSTVVLMRAALDGLGVVNVPANYAMSPGREHNLVHLFPDWGSAEKTTFYIVFPAAHHVPARVRRLIEFMQDSCANMSFLPRAQANG